MSGANNGETVARGMSKTMKERVLLLLSLATAVTRSSSYRHAERAEAAALLQELLNAHGYVFENDDAPVEVLLDYCEGVINNHGAALVDQIAAAYLMSKAMSSKAYREWSRHKERAETEGREAELRRAAEYEVEGARKPVRAEWQPGVDDQDPDPADPPPIPADED